MLYTEYFTLRVFADQVTYTHTCTRAHILMQMAIYLYAHTHMHINILLTMFYLDELINLSDFKVSTQPFKVWIIKH